MTGIYMRVRRKNEWLNLDIIELTKPELFEAFKDSTKERVLEFFAAVTKWTREHASTET